MTFIVDDDGNNINLSLSIDYNDKRQEVTDFRCDQCGKYFAASRSLVLHKKIHTGIKPYVCPHEGCGKAFYVRAQLTRHSYSHSNVRTEKCPYKNCTSPIKLFKTKADVRQHVKNWHNLEKSEQREVKLMKKIEKWKKFADTYKKLRDRNRELEDENRHLKAELEDIQHGDKVPFLAEKNHSANGSTHESKARRPIPAYTQFLREQYQRMKDQGEKLPFTECSRQISKLWHNLPEEEKKPYIDRFRKEMDDFNANRFIPREAINEGILSESSPSFIQSTSSLKEVMICRKCGSTDIYYSCPSTNLFQDPYSHRDLPDPTIPAIQIIPNSL